MKEKSHFWMMFPVKSLPSTKRLSVAIYLFTRSTVQRSSPKSALQLRETFKPMLWDKLRDKLRNQCFTTLLRLTALLCHIFKNYNAYHCLHVKVNTSSWKYWHSKIFMGCTLNTHLWILYHKGNLKEFHSILLYFLWFLMKHIGN